MTFSSYETSVESGQPVELYKFVIGTSSYYYTSSPDIIVFADHTYYPRQIERSAVVQSAEDRQQQIEVTLPSEDDVAARFVGIVPGSITYLTIYRYHRGDPNIMVLWSGVVAGASYITQGGQCKLRGLTTEGGINRSIPSFKYQGLCNHVLFNPGCGVGADSFRFNGVCSTISGSTITIPGIYAAHGANWMVAGLLNLGDYDYRLVVSQDHDVLTMYLPFEHSPIGKAIKCYAGCNHSTTDCSTKFSNLARYGGFPYVPELNPFTAGIG